MLKYATFGAVAQLGERRVRNAKVGSSILLRSTKFHKLFMVSIGGTWVVVPIKTSSAARHFPARIYIPLPAGPPARHLL